MNLEIEKSYGFLPIVRNMSKDIGKNLTGKNSQKHLDRVKQSATNAPKFASKKQFRKQQKQPVI